MGIDYTEKMPDLLFTYDKDFYPNDDELPDPQVNPIIPGAKVPIQKVGIAPVDMPISIRRRDHNHSEKLLAQASLYCSLDDPEAKGLNLSRFYILMHDKMADHDGLGAIYETLQEMANKQGSNNAFCKLRFKYPWVQEALRTRDKDAAQKAQGHIAYNVEFEGRWSRINNEYKYFLTIDYIYSSTCPCSFELAKDATDKRKVAANAHSQRSRARVTIQFKPEELVWIEDVIELCREYIPTEVQIVVKRRDEQAFAELNGANLLFSEDVCRIMYGALDDWYNQNRILDFRVVVEHFESLHPWNAVGVIYKGIEGGLS